MRDESHYVVGTITRFLNGSPNRWDWDRFTTRALRDAELDRIRRCAGAVQLPLDAEGRAILQGLLEQAELVSETDPTKPTTWKVEAGMVVGLLMGAVLWWANYLPGQSLFHNLHLLLFPIALGMFAVNFRNSRMKVGAYDPKIVTQNKRGRV